MAAYTDATKVASYLGVTLTGAQQTQAGVLSDAATAWIDRYTGRTWQAVSPVTDEQHGMIGNHVYLARRPVLTVTSVKTRGVFEGATVTTLTSGQYELLNGPTGVLLIEGWQNGDYLALVSYTHAGSIAPADVALAATMIAAGWLSQTLRPSTNGLESISVGQNDVSVKFSASRSDVPREALSILNGYRTVVVA